MKRIYLICFYALLVLNVSAQVDRSKKPAAGPAPVINFETPKSFVLKNGIKVMVVEDHKLPIVSASFSMTRTPQLYKDKNGVNTFISAMLSEGTTKRSKAEFDEAVDLLGATVNAHASGGYATALSKDFEKALALLAESMMEPAFEQQSFDKVKEQYLTSLQANERNTNTIARRVNRLITFSSNHPYGEFETVENAKGITLQDVKNEYKRAFMPNESYLVLSGDITEKEARRLVDKFFASWAKGNLQEKAVPVIAPASKTQVFVVDVPTASQAVMYVGNLVKNTQHNPDHYALSVANQVLGGGTDGYLFMNLREKNSYTYGAYSGIGTDKFGASFNASANVGNAVVDSAVYETLKEMERLMNEPAETSAINLVKSKETGRFALSMENKATTAHFAINIDREKLPKDYYSNYLKNISKVNAADIQRVAKQYMNVNAMNIVVAGKAEEIGPRLERLGYAVTYLDSYGKQIDKPVAAPAAAASL